MSLIFSASAARSMLKYCPPERTPAYEDAKFPVNEDDGNGGTIKRYLTAKQFDGDSNMVHHLMRDSLKEFEGIAETCNWNDAKMLKEFRTNILIGKGVETWDEAIDKGNIDVDNPNEDDWELAFNNYLEELGR